MVIVRVPRFAPLLLVAVLAGCAHGLPTRPQPPGKPVAAARLVAKSGTVSGVVVAPAGILSNNGSGLVGEHGGAVIGQGPFPSVISDQGSSYRLASLDGHPLANTAVFLADAEGSPLPGAGRTDAQGRYAFRNVPLGLTVRVVALAIGVDARPTTLQTLVRASEQEVTAEITLSTTFVAAVTRGLEGFDPEAFRGLVAATAERLTAADAELASEPARIPARMQELAAKPTLAPSPTPARYATGATPYGLALDLDGNPWTANYSSNDVSCRLPGGAMRVSRDPLAQGPRAVAAGPGVVWVANQGSHNVSRFAVPTGKPMDPIELGSGAVPVAIALDAAGHVWVADYNQGQVVELDPAGNRLGSHPVGGNPLALAFGPDGNLWVANAGSASVSELAADGSALATYAVGAGPQAITVDARGTAWVADGSGISRIAAGTVETWPVDAKPYGLAGDGEGGLWLADEAHARVLHLGSDGQVAGSYPAGELPTALVPDPAGQGLWVTGRGSNDLRQIRP